MPTIQVNGVELFYDLSGPEAAPVVVFSNSIGATVEMWDSQVAALRGRYRCLRYDTRGHGRSGTLDQPMQIDGLADDLLALLDALGIGRVHLVGLSLGGMTAQSFALRYPERLQTIVLMATTAFLPSREEWQRRADLVRSAGMGAIADVVMTRWFSPAFASNPLVAASRERFVANDPAGYAVCCGAIGDMDFRSAISGIGTPTLIIAGADDPATPVAMSEELRQAIPGAEMLIVPRAAHLLVIEQPEIVNAYLAAFLDRHRGPGADADSGFDAGLVNRKAVLGAEHVERSLRTAGPFAAPWQDFITRYAWAEVWGDPALPWKTRSLITLATLLALNREEEFKLHLRPALRNGVSLDELRSFLKQSAIYAGVPAANSAFRWAKDELGADLAPKHQDSP